VAGSGPPFETRRQFLRRAGAAAFVAGAARSPRAGERGAAAKPVKPPRLRKGDLVGLVAPASANFLSTDIEIAQEVARALDLEPRLGAHVRDRHGYLAGRDEDGAADVSAFFADARIRAVFAIRGGWGCARVLPHLDWCAMGRNPKVLAGYSDITALHCALHARTGLVTFHAPNALAAWPPFSVEHFRRVVFEGEALAMTNPLSYGSLTLEEVLDEHVRPLGVLAYAGAMIGHQERQFTVPIGIEAEIDAEAGTIAMLEPAVV